MSKNQVDNPESSENTIAKVLALRRNVLENPKSAEAHCDLGVAMIQARDPKAAIRYFKQALAIDQNHERSYYNLGLCNQQLGFIDNAINAYEAVIRLNPKDDQAWSNLASLFYQRNELKETIEFYQKALEINPGSPEVWFNLSVVQYQVERYDDSITSVKKSIELDESRYWYWQQLGQSYYALHDSEQSIQAFLKAIGLNDTCDKSWNNLGNTYLLKKDFENAEQAYRKAIDINGNNYDYWFNLGELLFQQHSYPEAASCFSKVVQSDEDDSEALEYLAKSLLETSPMEASHRLTKLIQINGDRSEYVELLAQAYQKTGQTDLEAKTRLKLASTKPMDAENNYSLAKLLIKQGKRDLAYSFLKDSYPLSDNDPGIWYALAQSFQLDKREEEEFQCLSRTVKADPSNQNAWLRFGMIALQNNADSNALQYLAKANHLLENNQPLWTDTCEKFLTLDKTNLAFQCCFNLIPMVEFAPKTWKSTFRLFDRYKKLTELIDALIDYLSVNDFKSSIISAFGDLIHEFGYQEQAIQFLEKEYGKGQFNVVLISCLASLYLRSNRLASAEKIIVESLKTQPELYELHVMRTEIHLERDQVEEAEKSLQNALEIRQDHYQVWYISGLVNQRKELYNQALEHFEKSLSLNRDIPEIWYGKAVVLTSMKQPIEAKESLVQALKLRRRYSKAWVAMANLKFDESDYNMARILLLRSLASNQSPVLRARLL